MNRTLLASVAVVGVLSLLIVGAAAFGVGPADGIASEAGTDSIEATSISEEATNDDFELAVEIGPATAGEQVTIELALTNHAADRPGTAIDATVPDDWRVVDHENDGATFRESSVDWLWLEHEAGATYEPAVTLEVPDDAAGEVDLAFTASDPDGNDVTVEATVPVEPTD